MEMPNVVTVIVEKKSNFTLDAYAYRPLTAAEKREALLQWLRASGKKDFPVNGRSEVKTLFGLNPQDNL